MEIAVILLFIAAFFLFGLRRGFRSRSKGENVYYTLALTVCFTILLLKSLELWHFDPVQSLIELFHKHGLTR